LTRKKLFKGNNLDMEGRTFYPSNRRSGQGFEDRSQNSFIKSQLIFKQQILKLIVVLNIDGSVDRDINSKGGWVTCIAGIAGRR
jgi:hypothetical protein